MTDEINGDNLRRCLVTTRELIKGTPEKFKEERNKFRKKIINLEEKLGRRLTLAEELIEATKDVKNESYCATCQDRGIYQEYHSGSYEGSYHCSCNKGRKLTELGFYEGL